MKKFNLTVIACIIGLFVLSMIAFQPTVTEASSSATPSATPRKRTKPSSINANVKIAKPKSKGAINGDDDWVKSPKQAQPGNSGRTISNRRNSGNLTKTRKPTVRQMQQENNSTYQQLHKQRNPSAKRQHKP